MRMHSAAGWLIAQHPHEVPYYGTIIAVAAGLLLALLAAAGLVVYRSRRRSAAKNLRPCPHCRRFIRGADRCPECGESLS